jgi:two-component system, LytTR family, sensor kinase
MTDRPFLPSRWTKWLLGAGFWTLLGLSFAGQFYISASKAGLDVTWKDAVSSSLGDWYVFALLSIPVIYLARRFRFEGSHWGRSLAVHALASAMFSLAYMAVRGTVACWQSGLSLQEAFKNLLVKTWHFNLLIYWVIVVAGHAVEYYRKFREREMRALDLEKHLAQAKLQALQMQLNPHFLFNTLHSISSLMHRDVEAADRMIVRLSDLLRAALESSDTQEVELQHELEFLKRYLEIEQTRLGDRLTVKMDISPETLRARVPNLLLQPLVENAIKHGIEPRARSGRIELRAQRQNGSLALEVRDNGAGLPEGEPIEEGVGLSNTRARLRGLYGEAHRFDLRPAEGGGLLIQVTIPFQAS